MGENRRKQEVLRKIQKFFKKTVDRIRLRVYNDGACFAGVYFACIYEKEVSCTWLLLVFA